MRKAQVTSAGIPVPQGGEDVNDLHMDNDDDPDETLEVLSRINFNGLSWIAKLTANAALPYGHGLGGFRRRPWRTAMQRSWNLACTVVSA